MLDFAVKLTRDPQMFSREDFEPLRAVGFSDEQIVHIVIVTSYYNYVNRVATGLGVTAADLKNTRG